MRILIIPSEKFVTSNEPLAGIFQYEQAKALAHAGHEVDVISVGFINFRYLFKSYPFNSTESYDSLRVLRKYKRSIFPARFIAINTNRKRYLRLFKSFYHEYVSKFGHPDIVHAHNFLYAGFMAEWLNDTYGVPFVITEHSSSFARGVIADHYDHHLSRVGSKAGVVSCVSTSFQKVLEKRLALRLDVLPNIVDNIFFIDRGIDAPCDGFTFLTIASLDGNKNQELLLRAFAAAFKGHDASLRIGGSGPLLSRLIKLSVELDLSSQVMFLGLLSRDDVVREMQNANCFVLSSNYETFGVVLIEALVSGLPLISTRCGGPEDIINADNGILVDVGSVEQLASAMRYVKNNIAKYNLDALRNEASSLYSARAFVKKAINFYERAIEKNTNC
jgi:glycosyltransferase involved in cell wall biosynthesis